MRLSPRTTVLLGTLLSAFAANSTAMGDSSGIVSDDFDTCALDTAVWTIVDPHGISSVSVVNAGPEESRAVISIPAGPSHDMWTTYNQTVRLMQPAADKDFEVRVKFDSALDSAYQMQGILIEQDAERSLRYNLYYDGGQAHLFAATFANGSAVIWGNQALTIEAPIHLSVARTRDQWVLRHSSDGLHWLEFATLTFNLQVTRLGPFAGNWAAETAPALTVQVDHFLNAALPLDDRVPSADGQLVLTTEVTGDGTLAIDPPKASYDCGEEVRVQANPAPGWAFESWSGTLSGSDPDQVLGMFKSHSLHATFVRVSPPLEISDLLVTPGKNSAVIRWTTSNPATSLVIYGTTSSYELGEVFNENLVTHHVVELTGLTQYMQYNYIIGCQDAVGQTVSTINATFMTEGPPLEIVSDDFRAEVLDTSRWQILNPSGQATFRMVGTGTRHARLEIAAPAGVAHEAWIDGIRAPWVRQTISDIDLGLEARFDSPLDADGQIQGIITQEDVDSFVRADFFAAEGSTHLYVGVLDNGINRTVTTIPVPKGPPYRLRVTRTGHHWTVRYRKDSVNWIDAASFTHAMSVTGAGPYIANQGSPAPAFVGLVDYFFNTDSPIHMEDGFPPEDFIPPVLTGIHATAQQTSVQVTWNTDEPADSRVFYGTTTEYELGERSDPVPQTTHAIHIDGLQPSTSYHLKITSADPSGNETRSGDIEVATTGGAGAPLIDIWYGDTQEFGRIGSPVPLVNILGNASASSGISSLTYSFNGGSQRTLSMGPNLRRLARPGDFNVEIPLGNLQPGTNTVTIHAQDWNGHETTRVVTVVNSSGAVWPRPSTVNWDGVSNINSAAQVVDGLWEIRHGAVRPVVSAYDRLVAVGDRTWTQYEVSCPITVHSIDTNGYAAPSFGPAVGLLLRWPGHSNDGNQPWEGVYPLGAIGMFRWTESQDSFQLFGNQGTILAWTADQALQIGVTYIFKMRVDSVPGGAQYRLKWWPSGEDEPSGWILTGFQSLSDDPGHGCILLLAHHVDASFGAVTITD